MTVMRIWTALWGAAILSLSACHGADVATRIEILGDADLSAYPSQRLTLRFVYQDEAGVPRPGTVRARIAGGGDAVLAGNAVDVDSDGQGSLVVDVGSERSRSFEIMADAPGADTAVWTITVGDQLLVEDVAGQYLGSSQFTPSGGFASLLATPALLTDLTDGASDPATYLLDAMAARLDVVTAGALAAERPSLDEQLNQGLPAAPLADARSAVDALGEALATLGFVSRMYLEEGDAPHRGSFRQEIDGLFAMVDGTRHEWDLAATSTSSRGDLRIDADTSTLIFNQHHVPVPVDGIFALVADASLPAGQSSFSGLIVDAVDCAAIASSISARIGAAYAVPLEASCAAALADIADELDQDLDSGRAAVLHLVGEAQPLAGDIDAGARGETLHAGWWEGDFELGGTNIRFYRDEASFEADRID